MASQSEVRIRSPEGIWGYLGTHLPIQAMQGVMSVQHFYRNFKGIKVVEFRLSSKVQPQVYPREGRSFYRSLG